MGAGRTLNISLITTSEIGRRAGRILLAEPGIERIGVLEGDFGPAFDDRVTGVRLPLSESVLVSDDLEDPERAVETSLASGISCVLLDESPISQHVSSQFEAAGASLLAGANVRSGIAAAIAATEVVRIDDATGVTVSWTEPGSPLRHGTAVAFPDPVGAVWGEERPSGPGDVNIAVPTGDEWGGISVTVSRSDGTVRIVGVADLAAHLEALALAAGAVAVLHGAYPPGLHRPRDAAATYLERALIAGLDVAAFTVANAPAG
jgi:hypothetical protein